MTKAKMPVAMHHGHRAKDARTGQVWTDELTLAKASADRVAAVALRSRAPLAACPDFGGR